MAAMKEGDLVLMMEVYWALLKVRQKVESLACLTGNQKDKMKEAKMA
jgi:hypothetical protein